MRKIFAKILIIVVLLTIISCDEYKESVYTITFDANGASGTPPQPMKTYDAYADSKYLSYYTVDLPDQGNLVYPGKTFYGWNTKADGTGEQYFPTISEYAPTPQIGKNTTFYAQWIDESFPPVQNLQVNIGNVAGKELTWDEVPGYSNLEYPNYIYDGRKFVIYVILRKATNAGSWTTTNFVPIGFSSVPNYHTGPIDISAGGTFEYIVALGLVTAKNYGSNFDVFLGAHSNVSNISNSSDSAGFGFLGAGNFMAAPTLFDVTVNSATSVTLSWRRAANLSFHPCLGFYVFYNIVPPGTVIDGRNWVQENIFIPYNDDADYYTSFRHTYTKTVSPSTTYYFSVAAVYSDDRGELATPIKITTPDPPVVFTGSAQLSVRNNYGTAISSAYLRVRNSDNWGNNRLSGPITTNNLQELGTFNRGIYEAYAESTQYYRVSTGTTDDGITVTGGVVSGYQPAYYVSPVITLTEDLTVTVPATGWITIKPE